MAISLPFSIALIEWSRAALAAVQSAELQIGHEVAGYAASADGSSLPDLIRQSIRHLSMDHRVTWQCRAD
jgi:hypothetical protein